MINDLDIPGSDLWKYVDDTTVLETISKVQESNTQNAIDTFSIRATVNKFELNEPKCKELRISFSTKPTSFDPIVINGKDIDVVPTAKLLGLTLSGNLKWNNHVDEIVKKSRKQTPVLSLPAESFRFENSRTDPLLQDSHSSNYRVRMPHVPRQSTSVSVYRHWKYTTTSDEDFFPIPFVQGGFGRGWFNLPVRSSSITDWQIIHQSNNGQGEQTSPSFTRAKTLALQSYKAT